MKLFYILKLKKIEELNMYYHFIKHNKCNYIIGSNT